MKNSVYNIKRRIASLPPISLDIFKGQVQTNPEFVEKKSRNETVEETETDQETISPCQCLFCQQKFDNDTEDLEHTLEHMFTAHGLFIPDQDMISDLECFLGYLATEVRAWHECLFCGITRKSTLAIQSHMRDSGHCMLNLEREPELLEFWEYASDEEGDAPNDIVRPDSELLESWECRSDGERSTPSDVGRPAIETGNELQLLIGKVVGSRRAPQRRTKPTRVRDVRLALRADPEPSITPEPCKEQRCHQLARRDEMGIQNIGSQQRHALVLAVKRSQKDEAVATRAREWSYAKKANTQKHDQAHGPLSWAKGGMHNLLPR